MSGLLSIGRSSCRILHKLGVLLAAKAGLHADTPLPRHRGPPLLILQKFPFSFSLSPGLPLPSVSRSAPRWNRLNMDRITIHVLRAWTRAREAPNQHGLSSASSDEPSARSGCPGCARRSRFRVSCGWKGPGGRAHLASIAEGRASSTERVYISWQVKTSKDTH